MALKNFQYSFLIFIFFLPFLYLVDNYESPFELIKITAASVYTCIVLFIYVIYIFRRPDPNIAWNRYLTLSGLIVISSLLSTWFSINLYLSVWGENPLPSDSLRSVMTFFLLSFFVLQIVDSFDFIRRIQQVLLITAAVSVIYGLIQHFGLDPAPYADSRRLVFGTFGVTVGYAAFLGALAPVCINQFFNAKTNFIKMISLFTFFGIHLCIMHSASRAPLFAVCFVNLFYLTYYLKKNFKLHLRKVGLLLASIAFAFAVFKIEGVGSELTEKLESSSISQATDSRVASWKSGLNALKDKPLFGTGPETFSIAHRLYQDVEVNKFHYWDTKWSKAHNHIIHTLSCTGLTGLLAYLLFFGYLAKAAFDIFTEKQEHEGYNYALSFFSSTFFLFITNLTSFNFVVTEFFGFLFPVLMGVSLNSTRSVRIPALLIRPGLKMLTPVAFGLVFLAWSALNISYFLADIYYQKAQIILRENLSPAAAAEYNAEAIAFNPFEPTYYCGQAYVLKGLLKNNSGKLSDENKKNILSEIETHLDNCSDLGRNRYHFISLNATARADLYDWGFYRDNSEAIAALERLHLLSPTNPAPLARLALQLLKSGNESGFETKLKQSLALKNDYLPAYRELFRYYYEKKKNSDIIELRHNFAKILKSEMTDTAVLEELKNLAQLNNDAETVLLIQHRLK